MGHRVLTPSLHDVVCWALGRRARFRVAGASMAPTLVAGDHVLVDLGAYRRTRPQPGDIVLARHPYRTDVRLVKRVAAVVADGHCALAGDNPEESADSRCFGAVPAALVLGRVVGRLG